MPDFGSHSNFVDESLLNALELQCGRRFKRTKCPPKRYQLGDGSIALLRLGLPKIRPDDKKGRKYVGKCQTMKEAETLVCCKRSKCKNCRDCLRRVLTDDNYTTTFDPELF
jgi:hypothetical protein